jgi:hypothetical protein
MLKKMFATFLKNVGEKILTTVQTIINNKNKKVKACGCSCTLNLLSGLRGLYSSLAYPPSGR